MALDEAYLDVTEQAADLEGARRIARTIKARTRNELKLSCSVGVAYSKTAAKMASEEKKPDGYFEIPTPEDFVRLILDRDVRVLYTVGEKTAEKLNAAGIRTVRDIRSHPEEVIRLLGKQGNWITKIANGEDDRKVVPYRPEDAKSIGREITFQEDVENRELLKDILFLLSLSVINRAERVGLYGKGVSLKLTYANMKSISRSRAGDRIESAIQVYQAACELLDQTDDRPVRLIGVSIYNLSEEGWRQLSFEDFLEDRAAAQRSAVETGLEKLKERYGLDFAGHLEEICHGAVLHRTVEYMRKYGGKHLTGNRS